MARQAGPLTEGGWRASAWLALLALLPRLFVALAWAREPVWDGHYYHFGATRIAGGLGYSEDVVIQGLSVWKPWCHYPVGYSGFLAGLYRVFGSGLWVAPVANALVGTLSVVLVHRLARAALSPTRAIVAGGLCAVHPGLVLYTALVMTELLSGLVLLAAAFLAMAFAARKSGAVLSGIALGLGALVRPPALFAVPWLFALFTGSARARVGGVIVAGLLALATISPWTLRNCRVMDGCALVSTNGGWNLAIGAMTETGRFSTIRAGQGCPGPGQVNQDRCWGEVGRAAILADPLHWLSMIPKKLRHTYNHESFAVGYLAEANPQLFSAQAQDSLRTTLTLFHHALMLGAALSFVARPAWPSRLSGRALAQPALLLATLAFVLWALRQGEPPLYWLVVALPALAAIPWPDRPRLDTVLTYALGMLLMTSITHAVFFGEDRYHLPLSPLLALLCAAALRAPRALPEGPDGVSPREPGQPLKRAARRAFAAGPAKNAVKDL